jgi:hypothetical protein
LLLAFFLPVAQLLAWALQTRDSVDARYLGFIGPRYYWLAAARWQPVHLH